MKGLRISHVSPRDINVVLLYKKLLNPTLKESLFTLCLKWQFKNTSVKAAHSEIHCMTPLANKTKVTLVQH